MRSAAKAPGRTGAERGHQADEGGIERPETSWRDRNRARQPCDRERGEHGDERDLSGGDAHGPHDDEDEDESHELIGQRRPREQPPSTVDDVGGLTLELCKGALDPIRCRSSKEAQHPVDHVVGQSPEPVCPGGEPEEQPQCDSGDHHGDDAGNGGVEDPCRRVPCYRQ